MTGQELLSGKLIAGVLLILAFIAFAIGASLPTLGKQGNFRFFNLPVREYLEAIANRANMWRWANVFMGAGGVLLAAGLTMLATLLESQGEHLLSRLGVVGFLLAAAMWVVFSAYRGSVTIRAAQETMAGSSVPQYYEPLAQWGYSLFYIYAVLGYLSLAAFGLSVVMTGLLPAWVGWATVVYSVVLLGLLLQSGDSLPAFHYLPPLLMGILLLVLR